MLLRSANLGAPYILGLCEKWRGPLHLQIFLGKVQNTELFPILWTFFYFKVRDQPSTKGGGWGRWGYTLPAWQDVLCYILTWPPS
jgi:hypothetical protein